MRFRILRESSKALKQAKPRTPTKQRASGKSKQRWREPVRVSSKEKGDALETRVAHLFQRLGYTVQRNVLIRNAQGNLSELDIIVTSKLPWRGDMYVECKNYSRPLPLHSVATFKEVLLQNNLPLNNGLLVTTATLTPRVRSAGIRVWDGEDLKRVESGVTRRVIAWQLLRLCAGLGALYAGLLLSVPGLEWMERRDLLPRALTEPIDGEGDDSSVASLSPIGLLKSHREWWSRAASAAAASPAVSWVREAVPEQLQRQAAEVVEGVGVLVDRVAGLAGAVRKAARGDKDRS